MLKSSSDINKLAKTFLKKRVMEAGISDLHDLIFSFLKTTFKKMPPNNLHYRN